MVCVSAAQDHMKSMLRLDSTRLSSPTTQTQFDPNAVAGRRRRPLTLSLTGALCYSLLESIVVSETIFLGTDESRRYSLPFIYIQIYTWIWVEYDALNDVLFVTINYFLSLLTTAAIFSFELIWAPFEAAVAL